jgi:hypothetical protein
VRLGGFGGLGGVGVVEGAECFLEIMAMTNVRPKLQNAPTNLRRDSAL